ncbi:MAG: PAS domain-containing sensor histidine kinase [Proteobacteria bacterium]|nr:PAS domain-containing sensor histidine kinase [Pseudomonadota bacterium]
MNALSETPVRIIENLATAVLLFGKDLQLLFINSAGEGLLSVSHNRVAGMTPKQIWPNSSFFYEAIQRALYSGSTCIERGVELNLNNAQTILVDCMITPVLVNEAAEEILVELVDTDAFVRVMQEANQQTVQEAAKESVQGMAHEIKNPLGGIRGAAQLLERELENKDLLEYTQLIINESDRLRHFIDRMLTTSNQPAKSAMNIHEVLEYVVSVVCAENEQPLKFKKDYDPSIPSIKADREQIIQAILNLIRNAVQAIDDDGVITLRTRIRRQVTIQHRLNRHIIEVDIIDDGPGIPPEIEAGAFYPLVTGRAEGTGLGLSIAQQLIQSHGGLINYERKESDTYFSILLPMEYENE